MSEISEDEEENGSEEEDEVPELPMDDNDRSPTRRRSSPVKVMRRSHSLQPEHSNFN